MGKLVLKRTTQKATKKKKAKQANSVNGSPPRLQGSLSERSQGGHPDYCPYKECRRQADQRDQ